MATGIYIPAVIPLITSYYDEKIWSKTIAIHDSAASLGVRSAFACYFSPPIFSMERGIRHHGFYFVIGATAFYLLFNGLKVARVTKAVFADLSEGEPSGF